MSFRRELIGYEALTTQLKEWAAEHEFVTLESAGKSGDGRELWVLIVGHEPSRARPAAWVDGNMHASELAGTNVCLAIAEDLIALQLGTSKLPAPMSETVSEMLVYIMPRMSPDGAEVVLEEARYVRSVPRDDRTAQEAARWVSSDLDGDGRALLMRVVDVAGEFVESATRPGLMVIRTLEDAGPFYKLYPEGTIEGYDGVQIPSPNFLSDNDTDLNRNFPYHWAPEPDQVGAGSYPMSAPESRSVVEYTTARPHLYVWLNFHCFGGVHIRPLGGARDAAMQPYDLALFKQLEEWAEEHTGYPMVSGFEEFTYDEGQALHGDLSDYAYTQRGCLSWVCELWDLFEQLGLERPKRFVERYTRMERKDFEALYDWDKKSNGNRLFQPWVSVSHPQLGDAQVGGLDPRYGIWNPPPDELEKICDGHAALFLRACSMVPKLRIRDVRVEALGGDTFRVSAKLVNEGYMPTNGVDVAMGRPFNEELFVRLEADAAEVAAGDSKVALGHLRGWGHGRHSGFGGLFYQRSQGSQHMRHMSAVVKGSGNVRIRFGSSRTGFVQEDVVLP
ncbi:MAG: hypothetical protein ACI9KE_003028 [Polyangiales bacterium]|jgi:hypothetical protein